MDGSILWKWVEGPIQGRKRNSVFYYLDGDIPKDLKDLNVKAADEEGDILEMMSVDENKPTRKEFTVKLKKPIRSKQRNRYVKLEYDWEEPERNYFYKIPTDCKKFNYKFSIPNTIDIKPRILKIDTDLGYKWIANPPPTVTYGKKRTDVTWEAKNLKAYDTYKFEW